MKMLPKCSFGKLSVGLTMFFLLLMLIFFSFMFIGLVTFDEGHWWDVTVAISVSVEILALILGIISVRKRNETSALVYLSIFIGISVILFGLLHSLFIHD